MSVQSSSNSVEVEKKTNNFSFTPFHTLHVSFFYPSAWFWFFTASRASGLLGLFEGTQTHTHVRSLSSEPASFDSAESSLIWCLGDKDPSVWVRACVREPSRVSRKSLREEQNEGAGVRVSERVERQVIDVLASPRHPDSPQPPPGAVNQKLSF